MPQLDIATYASQIFWLGVIFSVFYCYLVKFPLPVVREVLHNRQMRIAGDIKKAESLKMEAEAAENDFTKEISAARNKASSLIHDTKVKIAAEEAARNAKIEQNFAHQNKEAEHRMAKFRKEASGKLIIVSAQTAKLITDRLIGTNVDLARAEALTRIN